MARRRSTGFVTDDFEDDIFDDDPAEDKELKALERRLNEEVDEDLFQEPAQFNTLRRVIDVLGLQMMEDTTSASKDPALESNPAYSALQKQQGIVNGAIEHMAVIHCADLNGSVIQVGQVARQFSDAVTQVRTLRKQVQTIQDTLGTTGRKSQRAATSTPGAAAANNTAMSLRELWLKKLECEAVLGLLGRLDIIRAAPSQFDTLIRQSRVGAAVQVVTSALETMFSDDVAQVQALHKIMEQLLLRKQRAEDVVWETVADVIYLRTAEPAAGAPAKKTRRSIRKGASSAHSVGSESRRSGRYRGAASVSSTVGDGGGTMTNPFQSRRRETGNDDDSVNSEHSGASLFSVEDDDEASETNSKKVSISPGSGKKQKRVLIPLTTLEADLDLVDDERRCLEEVALTGNAAASRYADPVTALRILVECLARLGRLDDIERVIEENLEREIQNCIGAVQFQTFERLESRKPVSDLFEFRRHLTAVLSRMGCIIVRMAHLAEVVRLRISSDPELVKKIESPASLMRSVISSATEIMQKYVKEFLVSCLTKMEIKKTGDATGTSSQVLDHEGSKAYESGLFSLGIADTGPQRTNVVSTATRNNVMEMPAAKFVQKVLFPKTNKMSAEVRHALTFRRTVARWNSELDSLKLELADLTQEDKSAASYQTTYMTSIGFLDKVIQKDLLPVLQEEAVNGTVRGLERRDAFDPVLGRGLYSNVTSNDPQDIEMCTACRALYESTGPLFMALHRLPRGGEMYMPLVAVLEHVMLTFISRVKKQVAKIAEGKTALTLLLQEGKGPPLASIMDRRRPCSLLAAAYGEISASTTNDGKRIAPGALAPPESDTRKISSDATSYPVLEEITEGVEGEEKLMNMELGYLKPFFTFTSVGQFAKIVLCSDEEIMKAACLTHSLLKLSSLLESRLKLRQGSTKTLTATRALREANKTIQSNGLKMAKFCRLDMLMQVATRMGKVCESSTLVARDAVRIPSSVNDLGEYITAASDNLREAAGNAVSAYSFSSLEQYIPYSLMQNVRTVAAGEGVVTKAPLTMNGIEALDRSGSVLYRDLKGATSFDNSFWDMELAAVSFERSASFMAMMELEMEELVQYYSANSKEFSDADFSLMFTMTGPRRTGDIGRLHMAKKNKGRR